MSCMPQLQPLLSHLLYLNPVLYTSCFVHLRKDERALAWQIKPQLPIVALCDASVICLSPVPATISDVLAAVHLLEVATADPAPVVALLPRAPAGIDDAHNARLPIQHTLERHNAVGSILMQDVCPAEP
eukprot:364569-Chlamydomonas_euryale.AAC.6